MQCDGLAADIYSDYVLGTLAGTDFAELDSHLNRNCTRCQSEVALSKRMWYGVALAAPPAEPRRALRKRVIASVRDPESLGLRLGWWQPLAGLAALALAVFVGTEIGGRTSRPMIQTLPASTQPLSALVAENQLLRDRLANSQIPAPAPVAPSPVPRASENSALLAQVAESRAQVARAEQELARQKDLLAAAERDRLELNRRLQVVSAQPQPDVAGVQRQLAAAQQRTQQLERDVAEYRTLLVRARQQAAPLQTASLLADPNLRLVRLRGTVKGSPMEAHALVSSGSQVVFYASQLPALPPGRAYQLWLIRGTAPAIVSAGVFQPDPRQRATVTFADPTFTSGITTIAVTDEPETGSATPTGNKLLIGT